MNTKCNITKQSRVLASSRQERIATTLRQHMADVARGERLKGLRETAHQTQQEVADAVSVSLRGYQAWEAGGKIKWENAKRLGTHFGVDPETLTTREGLASANGGTPDLMGVGDEQLDLKLLGRKVDELTDAVQAMQTQLNTASAERAELRRCLERLEGQLTRRASGGS